MTEATIALTSTGGIIRWKMHFTSPKERAFSALATYEGRALLGRVRAGSWRTSYLQHFWLRAIFHIMGVIANTVYQILISPACKVIDFSYNYQTGSMRLTRDDYFYGSGLINRTGGVNVSVPPKRYWDSEPLSIAARYVPSRKSVEFRRDNYGGNLSEEIVIVHEWTHAMLHRRGIDYIWFLHNEAMAYIAGALYGLERNAMPPDASPLKEAFEVAAAIRGRAGAMVDGEASGYMMQGVLRSPSYSEKLKRGSY